MLHKPGREQAHVSGETDEINLVLLEHGGDFAIMLLAGFVFRWNAKRIETAPLSSFEACGFSAVGDDNSNLRARNSASRNGIRDGQKIRAASAEQDAKFFQVRVHSFLSLEFTVYSSQFDNRTRDSRFVTHSQSRP